MYRTLGATLEQLKARLACEPDTVAVLTPEELSGDFHGLNVSQVAKLIDAPALAYTDFVQLPQEAGTVHRFLLEGTDSAKKLDLARQILLDEGISASRGQVAEVIVLSGGTVQQTWVRDPNGLIYRIEENRAVVDPELCLLVSGGSLIGKQH